MSHEKNDGNRAGVLEDPGLSEQKERRLTSEAEKLIRRYMCRRVTVPGIVGAIIVFLLGFAVDRVAYQTGSNQAFIDAQSDIRKLIQEVMGAKYQADKGVEAMQKSLSEIRRGEEQAKKVSKELSSLNGKLESTKAFQASDVQIKEIAAILAKDPRITDTFTELDQAIGTRLKRADQKIDQIKSSFKIEFQESKTKDLWNYKDVLTFSFPVKHAWVELNQTSDEAYRIWVSEISEKSVTVRAERAKPLGARDLSKRTRWDRPEIIIRVWATSF